MNKRYIRMRDIQNDEMINMLQTFKGFVTLKDVLETPIPILMGLYHSYQRIYGQDNKKNANPGH